MSLLSFLVLLLICFFVIYSNHNEPYYALYLALAGTIPPGAVVYIKIFLRHVFPHRHKAILSFIVLIIVLLTSFFMFDYRPETTLQTVIIAAIVLAMFGKIFYFLKTQKDNGDEIQTHNTANSFLKIGYFAFVFVVIFLLLYLIKTFGS